MNTAASIKKKGYSVEEIPGGATKIPMWKLESVTEAGKRDPVWVKCGPFSVAMVRDLRAKGFREAPPASPVETPVVSPTVETPEPTKVEIPEQELLKCDHPRCRFETHSKGGLALHARKHKEKITVKEKQ